MFPFYPYRSLQMPVAEITPSRIAQDEHQERGLEYASSPPNANQLARTPSGALSRTLPFCPTPVSQAFLSTLWKISPQMQILKPVPVQYSGTSVHVEVPKEYIFSLILVRIPEVPLYTVGGFPKLYF